MYKHRLETPFHKMSEIFPVTVEATPNRIGEISVSDIKKYDAVVFSRSIEIDGTTDITCRYLRDNGVKIIFDIDDYWNLETTHYLYPAYKHHNIAEQAVNAIKQADLIFTPTPYLTEAVSKHNPNVYTIKTALNNEEEQWSSTEISNSLTRFGWIGGIYHLQDIKLLEKSIQEIHQKLNGYQLCVGGFSSEKTDKGISNGEYVEIEKIFTSNYKAVDFEYKCFLECYNRSLPDHISYYKNYRRLWSKDINNYGSLYNEIDISLVPLSSRGLFNQYKSELKLIEAGTKGKMAIVSRTKPYDLIPEDCVHFIDNHDIKGWYKAVKYCLENPSYVKEKSYSLHEYIKTNYSLHDEVKNRYDLIKQVCGLE